MKSINTYYENAEHLKDFITKNHIHNSESLLIQIFTGVIDRDYIQSLLQELHNILSKAKIIGSTTDGEILEGRVSTQKTVLSFTQFEQTQLEVALVANHDDGYLGGETLARTLIKKESKLLIAFTTAFNTSGESFLNGISAINSDIIVSGGMAGDNAAFTCTYIFNHNQILDNGAIAVVFHSSHLHVNTYYSFNWERIGIELMITRVKNNRVYRIGKRSAVETYAHYFGKDIANNLPAIGVEFPLIIERDGLSIARAITKKHDDGSLSFAGNFQVGDIVHFGYGDAKNILNHTQATLDTLQQEPCEALFIYSCMARRHFLLEAIESETLPLADIAPVCGFFTYGEFYTTHKKELLNQSMTILSLSESDSVSPIKNRVEKVPLSLRANSINALSHLINVASSEVENQAQKMQDYTHKLEKNLTLLTKQSQELKRQKEYLRKSQEIAHIGVWEFNILQNRLYWSTEIYNIFGLNPEEFEPSYEKFLEYIHPNDRELVNKEFSNSIEEKRHYQISHRVLREDKALRYVEERGEHSYDKEGNITKTVGIVLDITDRKELEIVLLNLNKNLDKKIKEEIEKNKLQEQLLFQQSRMAQMGEMISMIAHQWRQPLGAIASTALNLQTKLELEIFDLEKEEQRTECTQYFQERLENINDFVRNLTTTIDDFRNFYKPNKQSVTLSLETLIIKSLQVIKASLLNDNINIIEEYHSKDILELHDNEMMQVIINILKNAQDNFKEKEIRNPYIKISTEHRSIRICDNGGGIAEAILSKIFDPYFSTKDEKNGTGLGLYMSKIIVEDHHKGNLHVNNTKDGVCFKIEFQKKR